MASQMRQLKSILKPPKPSPSSSQKSPAEVEQIALAHARIIQHQRELEQQILSAIETLSTYPPPTVPASATVAATAASSPSPSAPPSTVRASFKSLIRPFQPSDYDDLIEERNILGRCGYALCARPRRDLGSAAGKKFALVNKNRADFAVVETRDLERWCGDACARRALYVRVQLAETAAWERVAVPDVRIDLLEEEEEEEREKKRSGPRDAAGLARDLAELRLGEESRAASAAAAKRDESAALSLERGDAAGRTALAPKIDLTIREKDVTSLAIPPHPEPLGQDGDGHLVLEGHKTRFGTHTAESDSDEGNDA